MEGIEDCFVKFFLQQAVEIEPETIQAVIEHGYKSKVSLVAMDLTIDLPLIDDISLAQRSLLRKYIAALQEHSPFYLEINDDALNKYNEKPNKKRKFEVVAREDSDLDEDGYESTHSNPTFDSRKYGASQVSSPRNGNKVSNAISVKSSPVKVRRLSIKYPHADADDDEDDIEMKEEAKEIKPTRGRGRVRKSETVRTLSQIRHDKTKELLAAQKNATVKEEETVKQIPVINVNRKSVSRPSTATIQVITSHVPTPAELAIRAKLDAKKAAAQDTKPKRGRPKNK